MDGAIEALADLTLSCVTPLEKLLCLKSVHDNINRDVEKNLTSRYLDIGAHQMTTDDLLDQLIYAIVQARSREKRAAAIHAQVARRRERIRAHGSKGDLSGVLSDPEDADESDDGHDAGHASLSPTSSHGRFRLSFPSFSSNDGVSLFRSPGQGGGSGRRSSSAEAEARYREYSDSSSRPGMLNWMRRLSLKRSFLATNVAYMQRFHLINLNTTVLGYNLANLEVAIGWFLLRRKRVRMPLWTSQDIAHAVALEEAETTIAMTATAAVTTASKGGGGSGDAAGEGTLAGALHKKNNSIVAFAGARAGGRLMVLGEGGGDMLHHIGSRDHIGDEHASALGPQDMSVNANASSSVQNILREHTQSVDRSRELSIVDVGCSAHFFCKVDEQGRVWTWGVGPTAGRRKSIDKHANMNSLNDLLASADVGTSTRRMGSRSIVAAGSPLRGGGGDSERRGAPSDLSKARVVGGLLRGHRISAIAVGMHHVLCMDENGRLFSWGDNRSGQLGVGVGVGLENGSNRAPPMTVSQGGPVETEMCFVSTSDVPLPVDLRLRWEERDEVGAFGGEAGARVGRRGSTVARDEHCVWILSLARMHGRGQGLGVGAWEEWTSWAGQADT